MKLAEMTWPEVDALSRDVVVVIPTGSLEQHGPHLPLFTDSILATHAAEAVESALRDKVLLTPTLWLGASAHHLGFAGSLSASMTTYLGAVTNVIESLVPHGFRKFYLLNGHGGNSAPNGIALRELKQRFPTCEFAHQGYYHFAQAEVAAILEGPSKEITHACEGEASLMMHVRPDLVRKDKLRDDGLVSEPHIPSVIHDFNEITQQGSFGYATLASPAKGKRIMNSAVAGAVKEISILAEGYVLVGLPAAQANGKK